MPPLGNGPAVVALIAAMTAMRVVYACVHRSAYR